MNQGRKGLNGIDRWRIGIDLGDTSTVRFEEVLGASLIGLEVANKRGAITVVKGSEIPYDDKLVDVLIETEDGYILPVEFTYLLSRDLNKWKISSKPVVIVEKSKPSYVEGIGELTIKLSLKERVGNIYIYKLDMTLPTKGLI